MKIVKFKLENGYYLYKLGVILKEKNISINKLEKATNTDFKIIKRYINWEIMRPDIFVLARFCDYLDCDITDIIEYKKK